MRSLRALERYARRPKRARASEGARCELCGAPAGAEHAHVVDLEQRQLCCVCRPCALLFERPGVATGRYRTVPGRVLVDPAFTLREAEWAALEVPVHLAFVFFNSSLGRWLAVYPSPAGATESELDEAAWDEVMRGLPLAKRVEPDVEALLVYGRRGRPGLEVFLAPIDACYDLVGRVRRHWRGFDGGDEARAEIDAFFEELRRRSRPLTTERAARGEP